MPRHTPVPRTVNGPLAQHTELLSHPQAMRTIGLIIRMTETHETGTKEVLEMTKPAVTIGPPGTGNSARTHPVGGMTTTVKPPGTETAHATHHR